MNSSQRLRLYASSGALLALALMAISRPSAAQSVMEFAIPTAGSQPIEITTGSDGAIWFTEQAGNKIGRITTSGAITEFPVPTAASQPGGIIAGPDGNLWFGEQTGNKIAKITTSGAVNEFPIPTANSNPGMLVIGHDGAIWFGEVNGSKIGRITTAGAITEFPTPIANSQPAAIVSAADGNLWFAEANANRIARITSAGVITEFVTPLTAVHHLVAGPDGRLYFTEPHTGQVGVMTTAGIFQGTTASGNAIDQIDIGPDGAIYLPEPVANKIARLNSTAAGFTVTEYAVPTANSAPRSSVAGPDGNLWFTEQDGNKIGRLTPPTVPSPLLAAVLPASRSVQVGANATAFATIINTGTVALANCQIAPLTATPTSFTYQTTSSSTNAPTGTANTPAAIAAGASQSFIFGRSMNAPFNPADVIFGFDCTGVEPVHPNVGLNTFLLSGSTTPVPDVIALAATATSNGIMDIAGTTGTGSFAVATANVGATGAITASADTGTTTLPVTLTICQTNPVTGACLTPAAATAVAVIATGQTPTFSVFAKGGGTITLAPATSRIFVRFKDTAGVTRGSTSVAVDTK